MTTRINTYILTMPTKAKIFVKELLKAGYIKKAQKGSHIQLYNPKTKQYITVPYHSGELNSGLEKMLRKKTGLNK